MISSSEDLGARFLKNLAAAVQIPTVSHQDPKAKDAEEILRFHRFLRDAYPQVHEACRIETINELSLLITWQGTQSGLEPMVLMAHLDVVPIEPGTENDWEVDPFSGDIHNGHLWGRGTLDDKGPLIAILEATEHLLRSGIEPVRTILIVSGHDEELGGLEGAKHVVELLEKRQVNPWLVLDEGGGVADGLKGLTSDPVALVRTSEKGTLNLKLTAHGEGGHSSAPKRPTVIGKLATALYALERNPVAARLEMVEPTLRALQPRLDKWPRRLIANLRFTGPLVARILTRNPVTEAWMRTTTAITMVSGGVKHNILPQQASAIVNFRIIPGDTITSVIAHVRRVTGSDIDIEIAGDHHDEASPVSSIESDAWHTLTQTIAEVFPATITAPWTLIAASDAKHFSSIAKDIYGFSPFTFSQDGFERLHGTGERVRVRDAEQAVGFFVKLIENAAT